MGYIPGADLQAAECHCAGAHHAHAHHRQAEREDDRHRAEKSVQDLTDEFIAKVDALTAEKEKEVLEV